MCFFRKKQSENDKVLEGKHLLDELTETMELLKVGLPQGETLSKICALQEKMRYSSPSGNPRAKDVLNKISNTIGDARISLSKEKGGEYVQTAKHLEELERLITEYRICATTKR